MCFSQLNYDGSAANSSLSTNNVGIGVSNPFGKLEVKEIAGGPAIGGGFNFYPLLRLNSTLASGQSGNLYQWDLRMDGGSDLKFYNLTNGSSAQLALTLSNDALKTSGALEFENDGFLGQKYGHRRHIWYGAVTWIAKIKQHLLERFRFFAFNQ